MPPDDWIYASLLVLSIICGHLAKTYIHNAKHRQWAVSAVGFIMALATCGNQVLHSLVTCLINALIIFFIPKRHMCKLSALWCFAYLPFFRGGQYFGFPKPVSFANGIQLILTLKSVGLAFEVSDSLNARNAADEKENMQHVSPRLIDILLYSYCFIGIFTGPYYKYRTYKDMIDCPYLESVPCLRFARKRFLYVVMYGALYFAISSIYQIEYGKSDEIFEWHWFYRIWFMAAMFTVLRLRVYTAWSLAECCCMVSGLGAYPSYTKPKPGKGPTLSLRPKADGDWQKEEYSFEVIHNIDEWCCEFSSTVSMGIRGWNMSVQFWLAENVYKRISLNSTLRKTITMMVSAYWHGFHAGYYLSFVTVPLCSATENEVAKLSFLPENKFTRIFAAFLKMRAFDYMSMGFLMLEGDATLRYWSSVMFYIHFMYLGVLIVAVLLNKSGYRKVQKEKHF